MVLSYIANISQGKKKKKPFINKKEAQSYRLVPRSQHDPLAGDINESQYVLKPQITEVGPFCYNA